MSPEKPKRDDAENRIRGGGRSPVTAEATRCEHCGANLVNPWYRLLLIVCYGIGGLSSFFGVLFLIAGVIFRDWSGGILGFALAAVGTWLQRAGRRLNRNRPHRDLTLLCCETRSQSDLGHAVLMELLPPSLHRVPSGKSLRYVGSCRRL